MYKCLKQFLVFILLCLFTTACTPTPTPSSQGGIPVDRIHLSAPMLRSDHIELTVAPGTTTASLLHVENIGSGHQTYTISTQSTYGWVALESLPPATITLGANESYAFPLHVTVPMTATSSMRDTFEIILEGYKNLPEEAVLEVIVK